jgi:cyanate permease
MARRVVPKSDGANDAAVCTAAASLRALPVSLPVLLIVGWGFMILYIIANILVQTRVEDEFRGRVMGVYTLNFGGFSPLGALFAGAVADGVGALLTVIAGAMVTLAFATVVWWKAPRLRVGMRARARAERSSICTNAS